MQACDPHERQVIAKMASGTFHSVISIGIGKTPLGHLEKSGSAAFRLGYLLWLLTAHELFPPVSNLADSERAKRLTAVKEEGCMGKRSANAVERGQLQVICLRRVKK